MSAQTTLRPKRVLLAISTVGADGRGRMAGIHRWLGEGHAWDEIVLRTRADFTAGVVQREIDDGLDGAIVSIPYGHDAEDLLSRSGIPLAVMTTTLAKAIPHARPKTVHSLIDNAAIGREAGRFFRSLGRFAATAYVHDARRSSWSEDRLAGFASVYPGCRAFCGTRENDATIDRLRRDELADCLRALPHPTALFAANDIIAEQVLAACRALALRVPHDVSVLGVDNDTVTCATARPSLSSIEPDFNEAGYRAAAMLDALMRGRAPRHWSGHPGVARVVPRDSTAHPAPAAKLVRDALDYIETNALNGISAADVIDHLRVSRSLANLRFRELTGESIGQRILDVRMAECRRLLTDTDLPLTRIAKATGFHSPDALRNLFRARQGTGPKAWRSLSRASDQRTRDTR